MTPDEYCADKLNQSGSNFQLCFLFLNESQKQAMTALYAFCREVDDIVDNGKQIEISRAKLDWWQDEIEAAYQQQANHPIAKSIQQSLVNYPLKKIHFLEIIQGMRCDLKKNRYLNSEELSEYCYLAASTVGLLTIDILGCPKEHQEATREYAIHLGKALQMTNILRDIKEDLERDRVYVPEQLLQQYSLTIDMLKQQQGEFTQLFKHLANQAEEHYQKAYAVLPDNLRYAQRVGLMMGSVYHHLLKKIQKNNYPVLQQRVRLNSFYKLWLIWKTARQCEKFHNSN